MHDQLHPPPLARPRNLDLTSSLCSKATLNNTSERIIFDGENGGDNRNLGLARSADDWLVGLLSHLLRPERTANTVSGLQGWGFPHLAD